MLHQKIKEFMNIFQNAKPRMFVMGGSVSPKLSNVDVDTYSDYKELLFELHSKKSKYKIGMIYENGNKYTPTALKNFIYAINPSIKILIYKNLEEFSKCLKSLSLT